MNPFIQSSLEPRLCRMQLLDCRRELRHVTPKHVVSGRAGRIKHEVWCVQVEMDWSGVSQERALFQVLETCAAPRQSPCERKEATCKQRGRRPKGLLRKWKVII